MNKELKQASRVSNKRRVHDAKFKINGGNGSRERDGGKMWDVFFFLFCFQFFIVQYDCASVKKPLKLWNKDHNIF